MNLANDWSSMADPQRHTDFVAFLNQLLQFTCIQINSF